MPTQIHLGNALVQDGLETFDCWRSRVDPIDILTFTFLSGVGLTLSTGTPTELWIANYGGVLTKIFSGTMDSITPSYRARDNMVKILKTTICQTFLKATPQEIIGYGLRLAGIDIDNAQLSLKAYERRNFVIAGPTVYDMIKQVNRAWGIDYDAYIDLNEKFHWHEQNEQLTMPVFAYGQNIIRLDFDDTLGTILTVGYPSLDHSMMIGIEHPNVPASEVLVDTVHHYMEKPGSLRTEIHFSLV